MDSHERNIDYYLEEAVKGVYKCVFALVYVA